MNNTIPETESSVNHLFLADTHPEGGLESLDEINQFELVRSEFLSPVFKPKVTLNYDRLAFSASCVRLIPDYNYIQMLISQVRKRVVILPCGQHDLYALKWSNVKAGKAQSKSISAQILCAKLFALMDWVPEHRYKIMAIYQILSGKQLVVFNLTDYERIVPETIYNNAGKMVRTSKKYYPPDWRDFFGIPYGELQSACEANLDEFYLMSNKTAQTPEPPTEGVIPTPSDVITRQYYIPDEPMQNKKGDES